MDPNRLNPPAETDGLNKWKWAIFLSPSFGRIRPYGFKFDQNRPISRFWMDLALWVPFFVVFFYFFTKFLVGQLANLPIYTSFCWFYLLFKPFLRLAERVGIFNLYTKYSCPRFRRVDDGVGVGWLGPLCHLYFRGDRINFWSYISKYQSHIINISTNILLV